VNFRALITAIALRQRTYSTAQECRYPGCG